MTDTKLFRQVLCSERLPKKKDCNYVCITDKNTFKIVYFNGKRFEVSPYEYPIVGWIEPIELPSEVSTPLRGYIDGKRTQEECIGFIDGFNKAIQLIKGE